MCSTLAFERPATAGRLSYLGPGCLCPGPRKGPPAVTVRTEGLGGAVRVRNNREGWKLLEIRSSRRKWPARWPGGTMGLPELRV